jgi:hypothetical protein
MYFKSAIEASTSSAKLEPMSDAEFTEFVSLSQVVFFYALTPHSLFEREENVKWAVTS